MGVIGSECAAAEEGFMLDHVQLNRASELHNLMGAVNDYIIP